MPHDTDPRDRLPDEQPEDDVEETDAEEYDPVPPSPPRWKSWLRAALKAAAVIAALWLLSPVLRGFGDILGRAAFRIGGVEPETTARPAVTTVDITKGTPKSSGKTSTAAPVTTSALETTTTPRAQALRSAKSYIKLGGFSRERLIHQLEYEKFSTEDAEYAADHCGADWREQCILSAKSYIKMGGFSRSRLIRQLEYEKFSTEDAEYAADHCGADWMEQAVLSARSYISMSSFSRERLIRQLEYEGFTSDQAAHAADAVGLTAPASVDTTAAPSEDLNAALRDAERLVGTAVSWQDMVDMLVRGGYAKDTAQAAASHCSADWLGMATEVAAVIERARHYSRDELIAYLKDFGFPASIHSVKAADRIGVDYAEEAAARAAAMLSAGECAPDGVLDALTAAGFTAEEAAFGAASVRTEG